MAVAFAVFAVVFAVLAEVFTPAFAVLAVPFTVFAVDFASALLSSEFPIALVVSVQAKHSASAYRP